MSKIIILAVIAVSANAQFADEVRETFRVNTDELRVNTGNPGDTLRLNPRHRHRNTEIVGGFQNGNFARHDGRLKTNLDSSRIVTDDQNFQPRLETQYVEEGAAFSRPKGQFNVHSNQGRADHLTSEDGNGENRRQTHNHGRQNEERIERPNNQRNQNDNEQTEDKQSYVQTNDRQGNNDQSESRNVNNDQNRYNQNSPDRNNQRDDSNDRVNFDQNTRDQTIGYNAQNSRRNNNENRNYDQSTQTANDGQSNSRQNGQNIGSIAQNNNEYSQSRNQNERNHNSGFNFDETVSKIDSISRTIADNVSKSHQNYDREAMDREINKQITKMIFDDSVQPERATKRTTKTTQDNELPSRSNSGKDDKWIWSDGSETTKAPTNPTVDDRAAFVGDQCPTGKVKFNNQCVDVEP